MGLVCGSNAFITTIAVPHRKNGAIIKGDWRVNPEVLAGVDDCIFSDFLRFN
jgi:hypothetical protein